MVTFKNGTQLNATPYGGTAQFQGALRNTLELHIAAEDADFDTLKTLCTDEDALSEIVTETDGKQGLQLNYTLLIKCGAEVIGDTEMWVVKLAQKSALELAQESQAQEINDTQLALMELAGMVTGG